MDAADRRDEIYVSIDVEADGPVPGPHSLLSIGAVALWADGTEVAEFSVNLDTLPEAAPHPVTTRWWSEFPEVIADDGFVQIQFLPEEASTVPGSPALCAALLRMSSL